MARKTRRTRGSLEASPPHVKPPNPRPAPRPLPVPVFCADAGANAAPHARPGPTGKKNRKPGGFRSGQVC
jgi:hypothetical protein